MLEAVQVASDAEDVTATEPLPALLFTLALVGLSENVGELPAWVTLNVWPEMVNVPLRPLVRVFTATV